MAVPLFTPRVNNNDDTVRLTRLLADVGGSIRPGVAVAEIETDKATFTVESDQDGYLLGFMAKEGDTVAVGSVLAWIGQKPGEAIPSASAAPPSGSAAKNGSDVSLKAAILLAQYGLKSSDVPRHADRLTVADIEAYVQSRGLKPAGKASSNVTAPRTSPAPAATGKREKLSPEHHGMLRTIEWHHHDAVPAYLEISYNPTPWEAYAKDFKKKHSLLVSPLVSLLTWRLVQLAKDHPEINATVYEGEKYVYDHVNVASTVQANQRLYLVVVREAEKLSQIEFVTRLSELQLSAAKNSLNPDETSGATIAISSMARWPVTRHVPLLAPHTAMMIAHTASKDGNAILGATYDHRVLSGGEAVRVLQALARFEGMS
jgi:pyruvate/2-oxoglutarate dehydrogenase complex dihydrolipoamide acyltransferase (E2) component